MFDASSHKLAGSKLLLFEEHKLAEKFDLTSGLLAVRCFSGTSLELTRVNITEYTSRCDGVPPLGQLGKANTFDELIRCLDLLDEVATSCREIIHLVHVCLPLVVGEVGDAIVSQES